MPDHEMRTYLAGVVGVVDANSFEKMCLWQDYTDRGRYYKIERDRTEKCLADIIDILANSEEEHVQVRQICERLTAHYNR